MTSTIIKRSFWTISKGTARLLVLSQQRYGFIFQHRKIDAVAQKYGINNDSILYCSVEKLANPPDLTSLVGKTIDCEYKTDMFGSPTKGDILGPIYLTSIKVVEEK